jgi:acetylornithine/N-succinyldiaminopimelate aminotransferase
LPQNLKILFRLNTIDLEVIEEVLPDVERKGRRFAEILAAEKIRQRGLMIGISIGESCPKVQKICAENGVLVNCAADGNLRLVPPLVITDDEIDQAAAIINVALAEIRQ